MPRRATQETGGGFDDQAPERAVSEPATGTEGGSLVKAPSRLACRISTGSSSLRPCLTARRTMGLTTRSWGQLWGQL